MATEKIGASRLWHGMDNSRSDYVQQRLRTVWPLRLLIGKWLVSRAKRIAANHERGNHESENNLDQRKMQ
jgi:hypothetical protein